MKERLLALGVPGPGGGYNVKDSDYLPAGSALRFHDLGGLISQLMLFALYVGGILMFCWMVWGIFQYIFAGGEKEQLAHGRKRITLALFGFIVIVVAYTVYQYFSNILPHSATGGITHVTPPSPVP